MSQSTLLERPTSPSVNPKPETYPLLTTSMSSTSKYIPYIQLEAYVSYRVPPSELTHHAYIPMSLHVRAREIAMVYSNTIYNTAVTPVLAFVIVGNSLRS
jgi:hypothetical protein